MIWCVPVRRKPVSWATFDQLPKQVKMQLEQAGYDAGEELLIYREITAEGKSHCRINGMPATVSVLRDITAGLINIHGQHDSQGLTDPSKHWESWMLLHRTKMNSTPTVRCIKSLLR